jgi:glycosyltransferase involved in cell wall biosynthesis
VVEVPVLRGPGGRPLRLAHLATVDMSLELLLGTELRVDVATGLQTLGISASGPHVPAVEALGVEHVPVESLTRSWDIGSDLRAARELAATIRELDLDILHTHTPKPGVLGRVLGRLVRVPVVVNTCHGLWAMPEDPLGKRAFVIGSEAVAGRFSHAELYQNAEDARRMRRWVGGRRQQVVGNGTDLTRFGPDLEARARLRTEWGIGDNTIVIGGVGRLVAEKGIRELGEAAKTLAPDAQVVWVGPEDPDKPDALTDLGDHVRWLGPRQDMAAVYNAYDVFVLPSYREGFSRSGIEAAATGLPLVLSDIRGCREVGRHEREAVLVPAGDAQALAKALATLVGAPDLRLRLGTAARERALAEFDQVAVAASSLEAYHDVAQRKGLGWTRQGRSWPLPRGESVD